MEKSTLSSSKTYYEAISNQSSMFGHINRHIINEIESAEYPHIYMVDRFSTRLSFSIQSISMGKRYSFKQRVLG